MNVFTMIKKYADLIRDPYWKVKKHYFSVDAVTKAKLKKRMLKVIKWYG